MGLSVRRYSARDEQHPDATVPGVLQYPSYSTDIRPGPTRLQCSSYSTASATVPPAQHCSTRPTGPLKAGMSHVVWGLVLASLVASLLRQLGARCLSSPLAPPQDRENCHVGGNVFVSFDGFVPVTVCNLYSYLSNKVPFLLHGEDYRGYKGVQRVTTLEYV